MLLLLVFSAEQHRYLKTTLSVSLCVSGFSNFLEPIFKFQCQCAEMTGARAVTQKYTKISVT